MTDEEKIKEYESKIAELEKQLADAKNNETDFSEIKEKYEKIIEEKNTEIAELNKTVKLTGKKVNETVNDLNNEVQARLEQSEAYKELLATVEELQRDKAEALVDRYIHEGKLTTAQKDNALKLALNDQDTFIELYRDAQPIIDLHSTPKSKKINADVNRLVDYFKN